MPRLNMIRLNKFTFKGGDDHEEIQYQKKK